MYQIRSRFSIKFVFFLACRFSQVPFDSITGLRVHMSRCQKYRCPRHAGAWKADGLLPTRLNAFQEELEGSSQLHAENLVQLLC